jgi:predicted TIM-barrel fold metal-dependent hydrolase
MRATKIALEEHVNPPELADAAARFYPSETWSRLRAPLLDIHGRLLDAMDKSGIETTVLSLNAPGIQAITSKPEAIDTARRANDYFAEQVARNPKRFQAFAALPMQDPEAAIEELIRCVRDLRFKGALVNGFSQTEDPVRILYYDLPQYRAFWAALEQLDVPFYLHPRQLAGERSDVAGYPWLQGSAWSFGVEVATHALRLMTSGLFDACPKLTIILGHLGETLPHAMWRIDHRIQAIARGVPAKRTVAEYLRSNFYFSTSGNFSTLALMNTLLAVGADRVLFSVDYPYETMEEAAKWFDHLEVISEGDWHKLARGNAEKLLKL